MVAQDVLKREVIEGDQADQARKKLSRAASRMLRIKKQEEEQAAVASSTDAAKLPVRTTPVEV